MERGWQSLLNNMCEQQHINSWKNSNIFGKQLELNKQQFNDNNYPEHWQFLLSLPKDVFSGKVLDIGCGCGFMNQFLTRMTKMEEQNYTGIDYADNAISIAANNFTGTFLNMDYKNLTGEFVSKFDLVISSALTNVLPDGDECLDFILNLKPNQLILLKILTTDEPSNYRTYDAYDTFTTYRFEHNIKHLWNRFERFNYHCILHTGDNYYLNYERRY
jgi:2-polyprenyl-3-methyl-5-hydroxy-6-metoxy-1,4-benzoquinol methylase